MNILYNTLSSVSINGLHFLQPLFFNVHACTCKGNSHEEVQHPPTPNASLLPLSSQLVPPSPVCFEYILLQKKCRSGAFTFVPSSHYLRAVLSFLKWRSDCHTQQLVQKQNEGTMHWHREKELCLYLQVCDKRPPASKRCKSASITINRHIKRGLKMNACSQMPSDSACLFLERKDCL